MFSCQNGVFTKQLTPFFPNPMIRAVPFTSIWFGLVIWVLIGGALLTGTGYMLYEDFLFANYGRHADGIVERKFMKVGHGKHGPTYTPCLDYRYQMPGMAVTSESTVQGDTYATVSEGGSIPVLYVSTEVTDNRIDLPAEQQMVRNLTYGLLAGSLIVTVAGVWTLVYTLKRNKLNRYLLASGAPCTGTVTDVNYDVVGKNRALRYYLLFTFRDNSGREIEGRTWYLKRGEEALWRTSSPIRVYYDLRDSKDFTVDLNSGPINR
jgi:hypothetical protein